MHKLMTVLLLWWAAWISSHSELWSPSGSILILQSLSSCPLSLKLKCWQLLTNFCADVCRQILVNCQQILNEKWKIQKLNVLLRVWGVDSDPLLCSLAGHLQSSLFSDWASPGFSILTTQLCRLPLLLEPCIRDLRQDFGVYLQFIPFF